MKTSLAKVTYNILKALDRDVHDGQRADQKHPRGVAILIALVTIALMSAVVVEFTYSTRVNLATASNTRDKLKSYYLAKSAINISSLMISFQFALQNETKNTNDDMGRLINRAIRRSNFQMYQYVDLLMQPFNSGKVQTPVGGVDLKETGVEGFGNINGEFEANIVPESGRITLNDFDRKQIQEKYISPLCALMVDQRYDPIFELKDDNGELMSRQAIIGNIADYIDPNTESLRVTSECTIEGSGGDENRSYDKQSPGRRGTANRPRNAKMTHIEEMYQVHGVTQAFMEQFGDQFTVYNVGKPNVNVATTPIFYSVLCNNVELQGAGRQDVSGFNLCSRDPTIALQVLWLSMALDGVRQFFDDPLSVLLAYVGSKESKLLPSAKKGQPVAFLSLSQLPAYIRDFQQNPALMAQFLQYSPTYQQLILTNPAAAVDPIAPQFPQWTVQFKRSGLVRDVSTKTPSIYRIKGIGRYGTTETVIETVIDFAKTNRRLPDEQQLAEQETDSEDLKNLKEALKQTRQNMPRGRILYWREY